MNLAPTEWTNRAYEDLLEIQEFISNKKQSDELISAIFKKVEILDNFPRIGQIQLTFLNTAYRYLLHENYKIIYSVRKDRIYIETIFDIRRNPDDMFG